MSADSQRQRPTMTINSWSMSQSWLARAPESTRTSCGEGQSPFQLFVTALCSWIVREQDGVIAFLREENRVLRAHLRERRLQLGDEERRRLAVLGHRLGRAALAQVATIATADTILRWHRELTARRCLQPRRRSGRPRVEAAVRSLIRRMATENATWGYTRIER